MNTLANNDFLKMSEVLDSSIEDVFSYLTYLDAKNVADKAQRDLEEQINKHKK